MSLVKDRVVGFRQWGAVHMERVLRWPSVLWRTQCDRCDAKAQHENETVAIDWVADHKCGGR